MQRAEALLEIIHERGKRGLPLERLYRKHSPLSPGSLVADAASDVGQGRAFTQSRRSVVS